MNEKYQRLLKKYNLKMISLLKEKEALGIFSDLQNGKNSYMRLERLESSAFETKWIEVIEDCLFDLGDIVTNPRSVTKVDASVVPVELAKKINGDTVRHLASHTQYIKDIDEMGDVTPSKLLSMFNEDDIHTYENRFIATFIRQLVLFIEKRYEYVKHFSPLHNEEILYLKNHSFVDGAEVEIETKVKVKTLADDNSARESNSYISRIEKIREYVLYYYNSPFMRQLKTDRNVKRPILQTNIIRKNPKYHHCYEVFLFLEKYDRLGVSYKLHEQYSLLNEDDLFELGQANMASFLAVKSKLHSLDVKAHSKVYKPKILTSMDDESFVYGPYLEGPVEFIRVDETFRKYVDGKVKLDLPIHPSKQERLYYKDEFDYRNENKKDNQELNALLRRKKKEINDFEKEMKKVIEQREKDERNLEAILRKAIKNEEDQRIEQKRRELIASALKDGQNEEILDKEATSKEILMDDSLIEEVKSEVENEPKEPVEEAKPQEENKPVKKAKKAKKAKTPKEEKPVEVKEETSNEEVKEEPVTEQVIEGAPVEETPIVETPIEEVAPVEETPVEETPATEETPAEEIPNEEQVPAEENVPDQQQDEHVEEAPIIEEPQEEVPSEPVVEPEPQVTEEAPINEEPQQEAVEEPVSSEETPVEQPEDVKEEKKSAKRNRKPKAPKVEQVEEQPVVNEQEEPVQEEKPAKKARKASKKKEKTPKEEPAPVVEETPAVKSPKEEPIQEAPRKERKPKEPVEKIPGRFLVKTNEGYYVKKGVYSVYKHEAKVFDDFVKANALKKELGGKVVKV